MKNNQKKINKLSFAVFALFLIVAVGTVPASADTSVAWTKDIGDVSAADMSEDGSVIYAAVGSQVFVYDSAGVQQNTFSITGNVIKLVCTDDGSKAALYTDTNSVYFINNGAITWSESFTGITDIDISNAGSVLVVEGTIFHKYLYDGSLEYDSSSGIYNLGVIDPNDEFAIVGSSGNVLQKYILSTSNQYWAKVGDNSFNTNFSDYQNLLILYTNPDQTEAIILSNATLGGELWEQVRKNIAVSNQSLDTTGAYDYYDSLGADWYEQQTASAGWSAREGACSWAVGDKLFIGGGYSSNYLNDVWMSEDLGVTWTQQTASAGWSARYYACSWVVGDKIFIGGGTSGSNFRDVWMSEDFGVTWTQQTASAGWSARSGAFSWVVGDKLFIGGGYSGSNFRDVWMSEDLGVTWTQQTASAGWSARSYACSWVVGDKLFIGGGNSLRDVWMSEDLGVTWTQQTASAGWSARRGACSWAVGEKLFIGGGYSGNYLNDVWMSEDLGVTWTQQTASAGWSARYYACSWVVGDKIFIGGGSSGNYHNDVWMSEDNLYILPSSTGQTYVFYNYTGASPSHTQTTYTNAVDFSGTYELRTKPTLSIYNLQTTKTLTGNISALSLSDRGDWLGTATVSRIYHDQVTSSGFGTDYNAALGSTGTVYDVATANAASMSIAGQGQITDIYSQTASRVGTYTAGGAIEHVDIADKNALWAASGGEDGKVYIFSKDASSNWYLEYSSDSEGSVTALSMSARGEFVLAGRTGSLTLYQTNTPVQTSTDFWFTLYVYRDSDSYRNAGVNVTQYNNGQWTAFSQGVTDSIGKYVVQLTAGQSYKFEIGNNEKVLIYQASPSVTSQTVSIYSSPITTSVEYNAAWDSSTNSVNLNYTDSSGQTQSVNVKILRTDTWETVYDQTFSNQQSFEEVVPIIDDTTSYKVEFTVRRVKGVTRNTFVVSSSRDIIPIPLDPNIKNVLFCGLLFVIAGLFSYLSAIRGAVVVSLTAGLFIYLGWVTIPWEWFVITVVIAMVAGFTQRRS